jgi:ABC-2 type transport system permease protein
MKLMMLVKNENMKLYRQRSGMISLITAYAFTILAAIGQHLINSSPVLSYWDSASYVLQIFIQLFMLVSMIIAIHILSREYSTGTMKLLLIRPHSRSWILLSKYIAILSYILLGVLGSVPLAMTIAGIVSGFEGWTYVEGLHTAMKLFITKLFIFPFYIALAFTITVLTRHQGLSLIITILFYAFTVNFVPVIPGMNILISFLFWTLLNAAFLFIGVRAFKQQEI